MEKFEISSHNNFLHLNITAIHQAQHIHAWGHSAGRDVARNVCAKDDAPRNIQHLQRAFAVDDDVAVADEREAVTVAVCVPADGSKH